MIRELDALSGRYVKLARRDKRPMGASWQTRATASVSEVESWIEDGHNVGLLLGPQSGVIDVEFDTEDGRAEMESLGLLDVETPTWRSARGEHRLFAYEPWMPEAAVIHRGGVEFRIGGRAAQSVLPPSTHPSGGVYEWIRRPSETPIAKLPRWILGDEECGK